MNGMNAAPFHRTPDGETIRCNAGTPRGCRICELIDPASPHYREDYRRRFHPEEFPDPAPVAPSTGGPSIARLAVNFSKAIVKHAVEGFPQADQATADARLAICLECPSFDAEKIRCLSCGCNLNVKIYWSEQVCPLGKW